MIQSVNEKVVNLNRPINMLSDETLWTNQIIRKWSTFLWGVLSLPLYKVFLTSFFINVVIPLSAPSSIIYIFSVSNYVSFYSEFYLYDLYIWSISPIKNQYFYCLKLLHISGYVDLLLQGCFLCLKLYNFDQMLVYMTKLLKQLNLENVTKF